MSNFDTVTSITDNIQSILKREGIHFLKRTYEDGGAIPASLFPFGEIRYLGETFEEATGERPGYAEAEFRISVAFSGGDPSEVMREAQRWVHMIRGAITVNALNSGGLALPRYVSRVRTLGAEFESKEKFSRVNYKMAVRYREA